MNSGSFPSLSPLLTAILGEWAALLPILAVFLGGMIAALSFWDRCPKAAPLTLASLLLMSTLTLAQPVAIHLVINAQTTHFWSSKELGAWLLGVAVSFNVLRALGYGLLIAAVFVARLPARAAYPPLPTDLRTL